jgi:hypothetical protein
MAVTKDICEVHSPEAQADGTTDTHRTVGHFLSPTLLPHHLYPKGLLTEAPFYPVCYS